MTNDAASTESWRQLFTGSGRLAGGFAGQGGSRRPADDGWDGRKCTMSSTARDACLPQDTYQPGIADAFQRQASGAQQEWNWVQTETPMVIEEGEITEWGGTPHGGLPPLPTFGTARPPTIIVMTPTPPSSQTQNQLQDPAVTVGGSQ
jgi:hypothetical protein